MYKSVENTITHLKDNKDYEMYQRISKVCASDKKLADIFQEIENFKKICDDVSIKVVNENDEEIQVLTLTNFAEVMQLLTRNITSYERTLMLTKVAIKEKDKTEYDFVKNYVFVKVSI